MCVCVCVCLSLSHSHTHAHTHAHTHIESAYRYDFAVGLPLVPAKIKTADVTMKLNSASADRIYSRSGDLVRSKLMLDKTTDGRLTGMEGPV